MRDLVERDIQIYSISTLGRLPTGPRGMPNPEVRRGVDFMQELAEKAGGMSVTAGDTPDAGAAARRIAAAMRNRYVIGYRAPDGDSPDKWHAISVKVDRAKVNVYSRTGYRQH